MNRRDTGESQSMGRQELITNIESLLKQIQSGLYAKALKLREDNTVRIDSLAEFRDYFTAENTQKPEIHGGFAMCHWAEDPSLDKILDELRVTIRCIPFDEPEEQGTCIFTGKPSTKRAVFGKSY